MNARCLFPALIAVWAAACTENEETIVVRADGSASVRLDVRATDGDLADGYAVPLDGPWMPRNPATHAWLSLIGPDTGSAAARAAYALLPDDAPIFATGKEKRGVELAVEAEFASVAALPSTYAPRADPYRDAFLQRSTALTARSEGGRRVYVFERRWAPRSWARYDIGSNLGLSADLDRRLRENDHLTFDERAQVTEAAVNAVRRSMLAFGEDAIGAIYLRGPADLSVEGRDRVLAALAEAGRRTVTGERVRAILDAVLPPAGTAAGQDVDALVTGFERATRDALRDALARGLEAEGLGAAGVAFARTELERLFTAYDHTNDLNDETFKLRVRMPGRIVHATGADGFEGDTVHLEFKGEDLHDREVVLRAVSVLE